MYYNRVLIDTKFQCNRRYENHGNLNITQLNIVQTVAIKIVHKQGKTAFS